MQNLYMLYFDENSVNLFYNDNFSIYLVILSDFDNLKLDKILEFVVKFLWMFCKKPLITHRTLIIYNYISKCVYAFILS